MQTAFILLQNLQVLVRGSLVNYWSTNNWRVALRFKVVSSPVHMLLTEADCYQWCSEATM